MSPSCSPDGSVRRITPVILAGGSGTRLWPLSREHFPKQLLPLGGEQTMIQEALARFADDTVFAPALVVTGEALRFSVAQQIAAQRTPVAGLLLEPVARNTAPAVAAAALLASESDPEACLLVAPSDQVIRDLPAFLTLVTQAEVAARNDLLVTFSILPTRPETGFGYIRAGLRLEGLEGLRVVEAFIEKPPRPEAERFLAAGGYFWNAGIFLFKAAAFLAELETLAPEVLVAVRHAVAARTTDRDFIRLDADSFAAAPNISVDYAVMEKTRRAATIACDVGWSDLGTLSELWNVADKDTDGNVIKGDVLAIDSKDCLLFGNSGLTAALGLRDLAVVVTDDAVLVADRHRAQDVKLVVDRLRQSGRAEATMPSLVSRPWGTYKSILLGTRFQVKILTIIPGAKLSLQMHYHRAEHWVVVNGTARITCGKEEWIVCENESFYVPMGALHRLENCGKVPLNVIEVQTGSYLGEDDIVRVDDPWHRDGEQDKGDIPQRGPGFDADSSPVAGGTRRSSAMASRKPPTDLT